MLSLNKKHNGKKGENDGYNYEIATNTLFAAFSKGLLSFLINNGGLLFRMGLFLKAESIL